jgi:sRNA-binding carbon storage regulator CsrA
MLARNKRVTRRRILKNGLVLTRRDGEDFQIDLPDGRHVIVTAVRSHDGRTRLHVHAPSDCPILRGELVLSPDEAPEAEDQAA